MIIKYYELPLSKLISTIKWTDGYGSNEDAEKEFGHKNFREISKKEYNRLDKLYDKQFKWRNKNE